MIFPLLSLIRKVAFLAGPAGERSMDLFLEEFRIFRRMGGMAAPAIYRRRIDIQVGLAEGGILHVMAFPAECLHLL
jgi:hypothetical protein